MAQSLPNYDPSVIERAAERLYEKASAVLVGSMVTGSVIGAGFGAVPLTSLGAAWPIPSMFGFATMLVGGVVGALVGYVIGDARAFGYRLQAQAALSTLALERNTALAGEALQALAGLNGKAARPVQQPEPKPAPRPAERQAPAAPNAIRQAQPPVGPRPAAPPPAPPPSVAPPVSQPAG